MVMEVFPSPDGELVGLDSILVNLPEVMIEKLGFRPLTGNW
ncbi:hypothetical protein SPLC1_S208510 [Arthrospira platensis C1]|nr:hypothetical protein SPLC1_S208510 [Arthrospira platensis C1]